MHLQESYGQLMPHELLKWEDIVKTKIYNLHNLITTVFSTVEEVLELAEITGTPCTQIQAFNIAYVILHRSGKFGLAIRE